MPPLRLPRISSVSCVRRGGRRPCVLGDYVWSSHTDEEQQLQTHPPLARTHQPVHAHGVRDPSRADVAHCFEAMRWHARGHRQGRDPSGTPISEHAVVHREVAADHPSHHGHPTAVPGRAALATDGPALHRAAAPVRRAQAREAQELSQLQLRLLSAAAEARLHRLQHVLPAHQVAHEAGDARPHVERHGHVGRLADHAADTRASVRCAR